MSDTGSGNSASESVRLSMNIEDGKTKIRVSGDRDTAVIVRSASGEKIYTPPEDFDRSPQQKSPYDSPYDATGGAEATPYQSRPATTSIGMQPTDDGYVIVHPEPVTDLRFLR